MKCPHCRSELQLLARVRFNAENQNREMLAKTECCGKGVIVIPVRSIRVEPYVGPATEDDWGERLYDIRNNDASENDTW